MAHAGLECAFDEWHPQVRARIAQSFFTVAIADTRASERCLLSLMHDRLKGSCTKSMFAQTLPEILVEYELLQMRDS